MDIINNARKIFFDIHNLYGEDAILKKSDDVRNYIRNLNEKDRVSMVQYLCRECFKGTIKGKPMLNSLFDICKTELKEEMLTYVKQIQFEKKLNRGEEEREHDKDNF